MIIYKVTTTYIDSKNTYELYGEFTTKQEAQEKINNAKRKAMFSRCEFNIIEREISGGRPLESF